MAYYYNDPENSTIYCDDAGGYIIPVDINNYMYTDLMLKVQRGEAVIYPYTPISETWDDVREKRNNLLLQTDFVCLNYSAISQQSLNEFIDYRQYLRNIPEIFANPNEIQWPTKPTYTKG